MAATVECSCRQCGKTFTARVVDRQRGWARFCSKSCKAIKQEARTHQHRDYLKALPPAGRSEGFGRTPEQAQFDRDMECHPFSEDAFQP